MIHPNEYYEKAGPKGMNTAAVGSGPFRVVEHSPGKYLRMERNKDYFKDSPKPQPRIDKLEIRFIPDRQTQAAEVLSGGLDLIMGTPNDQAEQMKSVPNLQVKSGETMRIVFVNFNTREETPLPALRDVRVRQAIALAIDRPTMVKALVGEGGRVLNVICYPSQFGCSDAGVPTFKYDVARAKALMAEAGHPNGFDVDLYAYREREQSEALVNYLRAIGIRANLRFMQYAAMRERCARARGNRPPDLGLVLGQRRIGLDAVLLEVRSDDISRDPEVRDRLQQGDSVGGPRDRKEAYAGH